MKRMGVRLVEVCREWSDGKRLTVKHIRMAMPGEVSHGLLCLTGDKTPRLTVFVFSSYSGWVEVFFFFVLCCLFAV